MFKFFSQERKTASGRHTLLIVILVIVCATGLTLLLPADIESYGAASLIPAIFLIVYIFATQRIIEALTLASLLGFIMVSRPVTVGEGSWIGNIFMSFSDGILGVMMSEDIAWLIIVCGLMGSLIALIEKSGGAYAFGQWISKKAKTKKASLMWTWFLGVVIFIDDYLKIKEKNSKGLKNMLTEHSGARQVYKAL